MARYRFTHEQHEIEIDLNMDGGSWLLDGEKIDESTVDPNSTAQSGSFLLMNNGLTRKYEWNVESNVHRVTCDGILVFEIELYEWLDT